MHTDTLHTYADNTQNHKAKGATYGHIYCTTFKKKHSKSDLSATVALKGYP